MRVYFSSFFEFVNYYFGHDTVYLMKKWIRHRKMLLRLEETISFLKKCLNNGVIPSHLNSISRLPINLHNNRLKRKFNKISKNCIRQILRLEIGDAYDRIRSLTTELCDIVRNISTLLPAALCDRFFCL